MKDYEVPRIFQLYHELLALHEAPQALTWLLTKQTLLDDARPCEMIASRDGYRRVHAVIEQLLNEKKRRRWRVKSETA